ncbi:MAG: hypothetical protein JNL07_12730, partial [Rhodospirillales bacterium]|nr:hypothetical protein [Rhodospirillales bacterium]
CGVGADCGVYGTEARAAFRFEPVFAKSFVEVGLVADAARAPGVRIRVEGGGLSAPAHVAAGVSRRFDVAVNGALTLSAETCDAAGAACAAAPVIWPAALCDPPAGVRGGPGPNPRATCVVTNRSGRVAVVAYHRPAWSFDVRSRPLIAGQVRIIGSHRDGETPQAPQTHILDCPSACGTIVAKPGVVRIGARFTNQPARPDAAADVCGIPKAADAPHLDADALAAIRRGVRLFSETEPWGAVSWICEYTVPADFPAAHFNVRFP